MHLHANESRTIGQNLDSIIREKLAQAEDKESRDALRVAQNILMERAELRKVLSIPMEYNFRRVVSHLLRDPKNAIRRIENADLGPFARKSTSIRPQHI